MHDAQSQQQPQPQLAAQASEWAACFGYYVTKESKRRLKEPKRSNSSLLVGIKVESSRSEATTLNSTSSNFIHCFTWQPQLLAIDTQLSTWQCTGPPPQSGKSLFLTSSINNDYLLTYLLLCRYTAVLPRKPPVGSISVMTWNRFQPAIIKLAELAIYRKISML